MAKTLQPRDKLTEPKARELFKKVVERFTEMYGESDTPALHLISDLAMLEEVKEGCRKYLSEAGVMVEWQNGDKQSGKKENPLLSKLNQTTEQQRKLLNELKLTPVSKKWKEPLAIFDEFEKF